MHFICQRLQSHPRTLYKNHTIIPPYYNISNIQFMQEDVSNNSLAFLNCAIHIEEDKALHIADNIPTSAQAEEKKHKHLKRSKRSHSHQNDEPSLPIFPNLQRCPFIPSQEIVLTLRLICNAKDDRVIR